MSSSWPEPVERVSAYLAQMGVEARVEEFTEGTPTAADATQAVGCKLGQTGNTSKKTASSDDVEALVRPLIDRAVALDVQDARFARAIAHAATGDRAGAVADLTASVAHETNPGASDPAARLADMDVLGIDHAVVYPTLFLEYHKFIAVMLASPWRR